MTRLAALILLALLAAAAIGAPPRAEAASAPRPGDARPAPARLEPGTTAIVHADGECLRVRAAPGTDAAELDCVADGSAVQVLDGTLDLGGYTWQLVRTGGLSGWVASDYLRPGASGEVCATRVMPPGLVGELPARGGSGLVAWGGGTVAGILHHAETRGVAVKSLWVTAHGGWISHAVGAPAFVNARWNAHFPGGRIPAGTPMLAITAEPPSASPAVFASAGPPPAPSAVKPSLTGGPAPVIEAGAAVVVDEASGGVLYAHNPHMPLPPASLTKIVTAVLAVEGADLDSWVETDIDFGRLDPDSSVMGLLADDCFTTRDLLYGLMLRSGNDAALALARHVAGSEAAFVASMNALVERFGLTNTRFVNPHGLHHESQYASAYDLAMLARYAMTLPAFADMASASAWTASGERDLLMYNLNGFLDGYDGADGVKTGFTEQAGLTLVASATREGRRLYAVLLNAPDRAADAASLLDWAFTAHAWPE